MHELPITRSILNIVLKHAEANGAAKVVSVDLRIGELSDLENEWMQRYFDYLSKDTIAAGAVLRIERLPVLFRCDACEKTFEVDIRRLKEVACPECGGEKVVLISGREFYIKQIEVM